MVQRGPLGPSSGRPMVPSSIATDSVTTRALTSVHNLCIQVAAILSQMLSRKPRSSQGTAGFCRHKDTLLIHF